MRALLAVPALIAGGPANSSPDIFSHSQQQQVNA
jgi:hypothetical protein